jgi:SAM dependent carboxyl methyltransferase
VTRSSRPYATGAMGLGYARHSAVQHCADSYGMPLLHRALDAVVLPRPGAPFRVADLGAAAGTNSLDPMQAVVERVRSRSGADTPVTVVHTDIAANDFNTMFANVMAAPGAYPQAPGVFVYAEARSFYARLFPAAELNLAWSAIAVHWLSHVPEPIPDHIYCSRATGDARRALQDQSRRDWERFLAHRAEELRPGGQLVVLGGAAADDGSSGAEGLMDAADAVLVDLVERGVLRRDEYASMTVPAWNRTHAEFVAPLTAGPLTEVLRLEEHDLLALPDIVFEQFESTGDAQEFADRVTTFFQAAFEPSLLSVLDGSRSPDELSTVATAFQTGLRARIASDPGAVETHWHIAPLRITRR